MRRTIPLVVGAVMLLWLAAPAGATPPVITEEYYEYEEPTPYGASCGAFEILITASSHGVWMDFYDSAGNLTMGTVHFSFTGTMYNSGDLTKNVPYDGRAYWTWDYRDGRGVDTSRYTATLDGKRVQILTGQDFYDWESWEVVFHGIWDRNLPLLCEALS